VGKSKAGFADFVHHSFARRFEKGPVHFNAEKSAPEPGRSDSGGAAAEEGIEYEIAGLRGREQAALDQFERLLRRCVFSAPAGAFMRQTDFICRPPFASRIAA
jgi:hypothetical protein